MSFLTFVFYYLTDFILGAQIMMCPKSLYGAHNQSEIPPGE